MLDSTRPDVSWPYLDHVAPLFARFHRKPGLTLAPAHTVLIREGERPPAVFRLVEGCVALSQLLSDGRRQIIDIVGPSRLLALPVSTLSLHTVETLTDSLVERIETSAVPAADVDRTLRLMLTRAHTHATLLGRKTATEKVASAVLDLSEQFAKPGRSRRSIRLTFTLHLTRADLADWLGLTVETVSRCLNRMKRTGVISFRHPEIITILDRPMLFAMAGFPHSGAAPAVA